MPKESNQRKSKDKECKQNTKCDYNDCEKKNIEKKTKQALKDTLKILNDYVETHKKDIPCQMNINKCCDNNDNDCQCECDCAKCVVAGFESCDAPEIDKLLNTVYTTIPNFPFPDSAALISLTNTTTVNPFKFPDFNYYVTLPSDQQCGEVRLLWPLVWMIKEIVQRLAGRFTGTGFVSVRLVLNVLSKKLIKDPAQIIPTLNTGGVNTGLCLCDTTNSAQFDYTFLFAFAQSNTSAFSTLTQGSTVTFSGPNIPSILTFSIDPVPSCGLSVQPTGSIVDPVNFALSLRVTADPALINFLVLIDEIINSGGEPLIPIPVFIGSIPVNSPAHYYSFIPSCQQDCNDGFWVATNLESIHV